MVVLCAKIIRSTKMFTLFLIGKRQNEWIDNRSKMDKRINSFVVFFWVGWIALVIMAVILVVFPGLHIDPCSADRRFVVTMHSSTTYAALLCVLAGAATAIQTPQTGEKALHWNQMVV